MENILKISNKKFKFRRFKDEDILDEKDIQALLKSEDDIENGRTIDAEIVFKEWKEKYGI